MQLMYEGTDITDYVDVVRAVHHDASGGRMDCLELEMENVARWYAWGPEKNNKLELIKDGYTTGTMYLDMILPEKKHFRIIATSSPSAIHRRAWATYENTTLGGVMRSCAAESGMGWKVYGLDEKSPYPFLLRKNEKCVGFLHRLLTLEGAILKCVSGNLTAIGILYAQNLTARQSLHITSGTPGVVYQKIDGSKLAGINVVSPFALGSASDDAAGGALWETITDAPAFDNIQASRWARGSLITKNRPAEMLTVHTGFNPGMTAMARIDVEGTDAMAGSWIVDEAEHDFIKKATKARLLRCVTTIK